MPGCSDQAPQFSGAGRTRRWAGRGYQPQNLPSRGLPPAGEIEAYIDALKADCHELLFDNLMLYGSASLRGAIIAPPGRKLVIADLSNIEGRMLSWIAGEEWKLQAFREYDAGTGPDLYNVTAASILGGSPYDVSKKNRNVFGKVPDLASGYQGGVAGYQTFAAAYHVKLADHWETIEANLGQSIQKAEGNYAKWGEEQAQDQLLISKEEWIASEVCKLAWRDRHPATVQFWYDLGDAAKAATQHHGMTFSVRGDLLRLKVVNYLGLAYEKRGLLVESLRQYEAASRLAPKNKEYITRIGAVYERMGKLEAALKAYQRVLEIDPNDAKAEENYLRLKVQRLQQPKTG